MIRQHARLFLVFAIGVAVGSQWLGRQVDAQEKIDPAKNAATAKPEAVAKPANPVPAAGSPQERTVFATLWVRTAAEYRALCLQTYRNAADQIARKAASLPPLQQKPLAVVLDLDETVLDNSAFQADLIVRDAAFDEDTFQNWIATHPEHVPLVPGAGEFLAWCDQEGITPVFISNRAERLRAATHATFRYHGLNLKNLDERLLLQTDSSSKEPRRQAAQARYHVLAYFGDNLRDFSEAFSSKVIAQAGGEAAANLVQRRWEAVAAHDEHWGIDWFVFPNAVYGEWQRVLNMEERNQYLQPIPPVH